MNPISKARLLLVGTIVAFSIQGFATGQLQSSDTKPAATQDAEYQVWTLQVPQTDLIVSVHYPKDWKLTKYASGQPFLYKPGAAQDELEARWEFDIKHGTRGRTLKQILDQITDATSHRPNTTIVDSKMVDRHNGEKACILEYRSTIAGPPEATVREYFFMVGDDSLLVASEMVPTKNWGQYSPVVSKITDSIETRSK
jgi:hypothetical protein